MTELVEADNLVLSVQYTFITAGEEVSHVFSFTVENQEQYEQYNRALHSGMPVDA